MLIPGKKLFSLETAFIIVVTGPPLQVSVDGGLCYNNNIRSKSHLKLESISAALWSGLRSSPRKDGWTRERTAVSVT